jgi:histidine kinase
LSLQDREADMTTHDGELHTRLFDSVTDPFAIYDREFRILKVNKALMELFDLPEEQLTGRFCYEIFYGRTSTCEECHVKEVFQTGQTRMLEKRFPLPGGSERIFEVYSYPIKDSEGITVQAVEHARDITKRKRAEEKLRESEEKYRSLMDHIGVGVSLISPNMEILTLNKQMEEWFPEIDPKNRPLCYTSFRSVFLLSNH